MPGGSGRLDRGLSAPILLPVCTMVGRRWGWDEGAKEQTRSKILMDGGPAPEAKRRRRAAAAEGAAGRDTGGLLLLLPEHPTSATDDPAPPMAGKQATVDGDQHSNDSDDDIAASDLSVDDEGLVDCHLLRPRPARSDYWMARRPAFRNAARRTDVFVGSKSPIQAILDRCMKMLDAYETITIHGIAKCIGIAVHVALTLQRRYLGLVSLKATTSTVPLIDDFIPRKPGLPALSQTRFNSAIHIEIART